MCQSVIKLNPGVTAGNKTSACFPYIVCYLKDFNHFHGWILFIQNKGEPENI